MDLHRSYAEEFGISREGLEAEEKAPTTQAYADFLQRSATIEDFPVTVAALLPCFWGFSEIGERLSHGERPSDQRYAKWIDMYSSDEFAELATWCRDLLDRLAGGMSENRLRQLEDAFVTSSRYEYEFWDMAYEEERWLA
jgi:thiaminase/transcriptional activator TenA